MDAEFTTMRMLLGLDRPTHGTALISGKLYSGLKGPLHHVGALLDAKDVHPGRKARTHLLTLAQSNGIPRRRVDEVLEMTGMTTVASKRIKGYSLGMSQRLGIAATMLGDPDVLMFDEPVNGLDPEGILWIRNFMRALAAEGRTVFVSSHLTSEMAQTADHLVVIGRGKLLADVSTKDFIQHSSKGSVRVRSPQSDELERHLCRAGRRLAAPARRHDRPRRRSRRGQPPDPPRAGRGEGLARGRFHGDDPRQRRLPRRFCIDPRGGGPMTTQTAQPGPSSARGPARRESSLVPPATDRFDHVVRAEETKFWSVRSTMWTFVALVVVTIGISALLCLAVAVNWSDIKPADRAQIDPVSQSLSGIFLGQMAIIVLGAPAISAEYSTGGIRTTLTAVPQRLRLLSAKALVLAVMAFAAGLVTMFPSFWLGQRVLATANANPPIDVSLGDPNVLRAVVGGALYVAACGLLGFALGALLRHTAGAITVAIGIVFILPIVANFLPGTWGDNVGKVLNAGGAISNTRHIDGQFAPWTGYAVFSLWWIVLLALAAVLIRRRDA